MARAFRGFDPGSRISATSSRSTRTSAPSQDILRTSRGWTEACKRRRSCCSTKSGRARIRSKAARSASLSPTIAPAARQNLTAREAQLAEHLAKVDKDMRALEHEKRLVAHERETLSDTEGRMRERENALREREETYRRRLNEQLDNELREARKQIDDVIADLKAKTAAASKEIDRQTMTTGDTGAMRSDARNSIDTIVRQHTEPSASQPGAAPAGHAPPIGDRVA